MTSLLVMGIVERTYIGLLKTKIIDYFDEMIEVHIHGDQFVQK